jgi:prepilin signal peptidase PulO-like enzyme (type II secretory pathway)
MSHETIQILAALNGLLFVFAFGAVVGSFLNVLVYRLPRGLNVVVPASACPKCETTLSVRDNVPIFGWLLLRGKCRYCKSPISCEYPLVELAVALLWAGTFALWFMNPQSLEWLGYTAQVQQAVSPEWTTLDVVRPIDIAGALTRVWPVYVVVLTLISCLVAVTLIDAKTFTIPLELVWVMVGVALVGHVGGALWVQYDRGGMTWSPHGWAIPLAHGPWLGAAIGGTLGVIASNLLMKLGVIPRSFADYDEWEKAALAERGIDPEAAGDPDRLDELLADGGGDGVGDGGEPLSAMAMITRIVLLTGPALALMFLGFTVGQGAGFPLEGMAIGMLGGLVIGVVLRNLAVRGEEAERDKADGVRAADATTTTGLWTQYPHARREMVKEVLFCVPILGLAAVGFWLGSPGGLLGGALGTVVDAETGAVTSAPPLWLGVLGGVLLGYLVGAAMVWAVRILGSIAFGKEAMGLGDVHLMGGVGACLGWIDPVLAFFIAPFFGIAWALASLVFARFFKREGMALPYGPHLAAASLLVLLAKPAVEWALALMFNEPIDLP